MISPRALGLPLALVRAATSLLSGWLWVPDRAYRRGLLFLLGVSLIGLLALVLAQRQDRRG